MHEVENSWYCCFVLLLHILSVAPLISFHLTILNPMIPVVQKKYNNTYYEKYQEYLPRETWYALLSMTMSSLLVSAFFGSLLFKVLLDYITRKQVMLLAHGANLIGTGIIVLGVGLWGSYEALILGRFVQGFMLGFGLSVVPIIVSETCVPHRSHLYGGILGASFPLGSLIGSVIGWSEVLGSEQTYLGGIVCAMVPSLLYFLCAHWITETPYQCYIIYGEEDANKVMKKLRTGQENKYGNEWVRLRRDEEPEEDNPMKNKNYASLIEVLKTPHYRRAFCAVVILYAYVMLSGLNNILFYSDQIFLLAGVSEEIVTPASIGVFLLGTVFACIGVFALNYVEPRKLLLTGSSLIIVGHALMTASISTFNEIPVMSIVAIAAMSVFYIGFVTIDLSIFAVTGPLPTDRTRPICTNVASAACWFFAWAVGLLSTYFQEWFGAYTFLIWMTFSLFITAYTIFFVPNTTGKTTEEIQHFFKNKKNISRLTYNISI